MKKVMVLLTLCIMVLISSPSFAMGPLNVSGTVAAWDASPTTGVDGYYIYWRAQGATTWNNTQRSSKLPGTARTFDLLTFGLANGSYEICGTATKLAGESGPSNIVPFVLEIPVSPGNLRVP